jgi:hypothetical protein
MQIPNDWHGWWVCDHWYFGAFLTRRIYHYTFADGNSFAKSGDMR